MHSAAAFALFAGLFSPATENLNFDRLKAGTVPPFWTLSSSPRAQGEVLSDRNAPSHRNIFRFSAPAGQSEPALAVFEKVVCRDADVSVKFKILGGRESGSAGLVWGYQDPDNYSLLQFSADQHVMTLLRMQNGRTAIIPILYEKTRLQSLPHDIREGQWYVAKISCRGPRVRVSFGNRLLFEGTGATAPPAGKTGLWAKAGTQVQFDDFRVDKKD